jgi:hypothetical protein
MKQDGNCSLGERIGEIMDVRPEIEVLSLAFDS